MRIPNLVPVMLLVFGPVFAQEPQPTVTATPEADTATVQVEKIKLAGFVARAVADRKAAFDTFERLPVDRPNGFTARIDEDTNLEAIIEEAKWEARDREEIFDPSFRWRPAMIQSGLFLAIQHGYRMTEEKTRRELDGPFFRDWKESVDQLHGWYDGGRLFTNYVAHPMQGAMTARIYINNSPTANAVEFGRDRTYWASRVKAFAWALAWSTQFEIGPVSEASIGNIGKQLYNGHKSKLTYGDIVVTPTAGIGWTVGEDAIDKFVLRRWIERKVTNRLLIKVLRSVMTPTRAFANVLRGRAPWRRDHRMN